jgi:hypothetical protein
MLAKRFFTKHSQIQTLDSRTEKEKVEVEVYYWNNK